MDLIDEILDLWCKRYSKGRWTSKDGTTCYIEQLSDNHLMRLPHFLKRRYELIDIRELPWYITDEIKERNMEIDPETFYVRKKEMPKIIVKEKLKTNNTNLRINAKRNKKLFNRLRR